MLFYSKPAQYALRAVSNIVLNEEGAPCQAEVIARQEDIPKHYLSKLLKELVEKRILKSVKGPGGGFVLAKDPKEITLMDIIEVFDDIESALGLCSIGWAKCSDDHPCPLHPHFKKLRGEIRSFLESVNIAVFAEVEKFKKKKQKRAK
ncbi:Rrf2 family transcriptional regulator [PVC group bacterium]|nr:Rrf2 family transcriptional regulator [PVC group bacterium]